jgi:mycothiol synthase
VAHPDISVEPVLVPLLSAEQAEQVRALVRAAPDAADNPALSEHAMLQLQAGPPVQHLIVGDVVGGQGGVRGYAQLQPAESVDGEPPTVEVELVTGRPDDGGTSGSESADGSGERLAASLLHRAVEIVSDRRVLVWAHGGASPVNRIAPAAGFRPVRSLLQLRRSLPDYRPMPIEASADVVVRPFRPGLDDAAWLGVNARAFAHHPEQGSWTQRDLDERVASDWFDAAGFLVAVRGHTTETGVAVEDEGAEILGYHWTKVHPGMDGATAAEPMGEVYVLGVDPAAQGMKLGQLLLDAGLLHLAGLGLNTVLLYVDESNSAAVRLYRKLGFGTYSADVQYELG